MAQRCTFDDLLGDARRATLDATAPLAVDCAAHARLPVRALAALAAFPGGARLEQVGADARAALVALGLERLLGEPGTASRANAPFTAALDGDTLLIALERGANADARLAPAPAHAWLRGVLAERIEIDLAALSHVDSSVVAWILQSAQAARPAVTELRNASRQIVAQLTQLRLDHLLTVRPD